MWIFWRTKQKVRAVKGGLRFEARCPGCDRNAEFYQCVQTESVDLYLAVEIFDWSQSALRCTRCGETFAGDEANRIAVSSPEVRTLLLERRQKRVAEEAERAAAAKKAAIVEAEKREALRQKREEEIDDELAALKRRVQAERK